MKEGNRLSQAVKSLDFYRLMPTELTEAPSLTGASASLLTLITLILLLFSQVLKYASVKTTSELTLIHHGRYEPRINITLGVDFVACPCS